MIPPRRQYNFTVKESDLRRMSKKKYGCICLYCGEPLEVGDSIISRSNHLERVKYYHRICAEEVNII